ncbi:MAG: hypothetical protein EXR00_08825 [Alphaproteobacteria bacterium]|nr:hypothetical protein [Alphaproteobacteria bacterium]
MDLPGAGYFYTLAQVGITFSGFAALLMAIRQMRAVEMSKFHLWVTRAYVQSGLVTAMQAMLSPMLYGLGLSLDMTWRVASVLIAAQSLMLIVVVPKQWRAATNRAVEFRVKLHMGCGFLMSMVLLLNAAGWPFPPSGGVLMLTISWNLFAFFTQFTESVRYFFEEVAD